MPARINQNSLTATIIAIQGVSTLTSGQGAREALRAAGAALAAQVRANITLTDHTLADLAALDHPYARRHGSIQIHRSSGSRIIAVPTSVVHRQSGRLASSLRHGLVAGGPGGDKYRVQFNTSVAPHARYVVLGTRVMLPRDPIWHTAIDPRMKKIMMTAIVTRLGKELRSKTVIRFGGL